MNALSGTDEGRSEGTSGLKTACNDAEPENSGRLFADDVKVGDKEMVSMKQMDNVLTCVLVQ